MKDKIALSEIIMVLEDFAPLAFQESYDNSGLQVGKSDQLISNVLLTLDITEEVVEEAINLKCDLIISHHPLIFFPVKKLTGSSETERIMVKVIEHGISVYSAHTNLDNTFGGVSFEIAKRLGLNNVKILGVKDKMLRKLTVYCPTNFTSAVMEALNKAGAGQIGEYKDCGFKSSGIGSFTPGPNANPFLGQHGIREEVQEDRIEVVFPFHNQSNVLKAMNNSHPYEEVAYHLEILENLYLGAGSGVAGFLEHGMNENEFLSHLKKCLNTDTIKFTPFNRVINKVAICGGAGSFLLPKAISDGADAFVSSDFKYHEFFQSEKKILIADVGHYESEVCTKELFYDILTKKFASIAILFSTINTNPVKYYH